MFDYITVNYFYKKTTLYMFDWVLNTPLSVALDVSG